MHLRRAFTERFERVEYGGHRFVLDDDFLQRLGRGLFSFCGDASYAVAGVGDAFVC
jgi:hypothetical protein